MICFFNTIRTWGGGEKWHVEMALEVSNHQNVLFVCSKDSEIEKKIKHAKNIKIVYYNVRNLSFLNFSKVIRLSSMLKQNHVETIVLNSSQDMKFGGLAAKRAKVKRIIYRRGSAIPIKGSFVNRFFFGKVITEILANSEATKQTINQNIDLFSEKRITVIPNGIDLSFLTLPYEKLYHNEHKIVLGNLGRAVYQKNQIFLLYVAKELLRRKISFKLLIGGEGDQLKNLVKKANSLGLKEEVVFLDYIKNPKDFMMSLDIFLLPSHWEGFGYVLAEALLCEKPAIAFDISSNSQIIQNNKNGFLTEYQNVEEFCDKIELLATDKDLRTKLGVFGKKYIIENFNKVDIKQRIIEFLETET